MFVVTPEDTGESQKPFSFQKLQWIQWTPVPSLGHGRCIAGPSIWTVVSSWTELHIGTCFLYASGGNSSPASGPCQQQLLPEEWSLWKDGRGSWVTWMLLDTRGMANLSEPWEDKDICRILRCSFLLLRTFPNVAKELHMDSEFSWSHGQRNTPSGELLQGEKVRDGRGIKWWSGGTPSSRRASCGF